MHIIIYDTGHFEVTATLIRIWDTADNHVSLFVSANVAAQLKATPGLAPEKYTWTIKHGKDHLYFLNVYRHAKANGTDYLFLVTVDYHHLFFGLLCFLLKRTSTILSIHDINGFFHPAWDLRPRTWIRNLGLALLKRTVGAYSVLLLSMKSYLEENFKTGKRVFHIPGSSFEGGSAAVRHPVMRIVVTGSIEGKRRDYDAVLSLASAMGNASSDWEIVLLGTAKTGYGQDIVDRASRFQRPRFVAFGEDEIMQDEFDRHLAAADFILIPMPHAAGNTQHEILGLTKCSGSIYDAVRHGKPMLVLGSFPLLAELDELCYVFRSMVALADFLRPLTLDSPAYRDCRARALAGAGKFTLDRVRADVFKQLGIAGRPSG